MLLLSGGYWYDREIFQAAGVEELPDTWEEFLKACDQIDSWAKAEQNGVECLQMSSEAYLYFMDHILAAQDFTNGSVAQNHRLYLEEKAVKEALDTLRKIYRYSRANGDYSYRDETDAFNDGKTAMYINGIWGAPMISDQIDAAYALIPSGEGEKISCESACLGYILGKTGDEKKAGGKRPVCEIHAQSAGTGTDFERNRAGSCESSYRYPEISKENGALCTGGRYGKGSRNQDTGSRQPVEHQGQRQLYGRNR